MSGARVLGLAGWDPRGLRGGAVGRLEWSALRGARGLRWPPAWPGFPEFRRLDLLAQTLCLAAEAAGLPALLSAAERREAAQVLASAWGCLEADLRFERGLAPGASREPAVFPATLPSTCLGALAVRHGLQGPTLCLSVAAGEERAGLEEALALLAEGEASHAVVALGDALGPEAARLERTALRPPGRGALLVLTRGPAEADALLGAADPLGATLARLDGEAS